MSGGWYSSHDAINDDTGKDFRDRGYTVFAVVHGSNPKFAIPEILEDMHRAVRYIRTNAKKYGVDPERLGITGGSAGGHLSLMQGCAGKPGDPKARDPIDRASSRVQAVACFYPPTDFLNWGETGRVMLARGGPLKIPVFGAFDFRKLDTASGALVPIKDEEEIKKIGKAISPISHVSKDDPPTLIVHGTQDELVPVQQAQAMIDALKAAGVPCELIIKEGGKHDGVIVRENMPRVVEWFDKYLAKKEKELGTK
jgi:acetyl esterase/lipase